MKKKKESSPQKHFVFTSPHQPIDILRRMPRELNAYAREHRLRDGLRFEEIEGGFRIGLERAGHSHGYWYFGSMEQRDGVTYIHGEIKVHPPHEHQPQTVRSKFTEWLLIVLILILFALPLLIIWIILSVKSLTRKRRDLPVLQTKEEILIDFMTTRMGCTQAKSDE
ncbi:MAG: hypothetical protein IJW62_08605 [Clostridia bacterium]|nr:hypothetical protein [Clostridia bacterium]